MYGTAAVGTIATGTSFPAVAEEDGRIVEMEIGNIDGQEGKTGKIRIQLHPEWAPRGVQRFEVSIRMN